MSDLRGRAAIVCGSTQGIGYACAVELARLGAAVTLVARDADSLRSVAAELPIDHGQTHHTVVADFARPHEVQTAVAEHLESAGAVEILVNNTGGPAGGPILGATYDDFMQAFAMHVGANQLLAQALVPGMKQSGYGRIINIISTSVLTPIRGLGVSNTTRAAVANWARTLADELGPFGITVNNVLPGYTSTARLSALIGKAAAKRGVTTEEVVSDWEANIPLRRFADPAEIGAVVGFLAGPGAAYVSGVNLPVDGGRCAAQ